MLTLNGQKVIKAVVSTPINRQAVTKDGDKKNVPYRDVTLTLENGSTRTVESLEMPTTSDDGKVTDPLFEKFASHGVETDQSAKPKKEKKKKLPTPKRK